jgi:hypothetical protein
MMNPISILIAMGIGSVVFLVTGTLLGGLFLWMGAQVAGIQRAGFGKSVLAALLGMVAALLISVVFGFIPFAGGALAALGSIAALMFIIQAVFETTIGKAAVPCLFAIVAEIISFLAVAAMFVGGAFMTGARH